MLRLGLLWGIVVVGATIAVPALARERSIRSLDDLRSRYGMQAYDAIPGFGDRLRRVKVAIIDNGFGDPKELAEVLPPAVFKPVLDYKAEWLAKYPNLGPADQHVEIDPKDAHGREMAEMVWGMSGMDRTRAPQIYLLNGKSLFNLERAVQYAIDEKVQVILYSQNYEYGGNFDGRGFINKIVSRATAAGILWINAAGNYGGRTFNGGVKFLDGKKEAGDDTWVDLGGKKELRVLSRLDKNAVRIVLSWNRNSEAFDSGTDRNLDLFLYDEYETEVASSQQVQILGGPGAKADAEKNETFFAREIITTTLSMNKTGHYTLRVKAKSGRFDGTDKIRIAVLPTAQPFFDAKAGKFVSAVDFPDATAGQEIMVPADHPEVITVGDLTAISAKGPTMDADRREKPDLHMEQSDIEFTDGTGTSGTSNAAALFAGVTATLLAQRPKMTRTDLLAFVKKLKPSAVFKPGAGRGIENLGVDRVRRIHPFIFDSMARQFTIRLAGRYRNNGTYIMAIEQPLERLSEMFPTLSNDAATAARYEIFLYAQRNDRGRTELWAFPRDRARDEKAKKERWEETMEAEPELFVQVVQARPIEKDPKEKEVPMWQTPAPRDLNKTR